jgi:hypothetical protein
MMGMAALRWHAGGLIVAGVLALAAAAPAAAQTPCANPVACENARPGSPPERWYQAGGGDRSIEGFTTSMSTNVGGTVAFKIKSETANYRIDIYRLGY